MAGKRQAGLEELDAEVRVCTQCRLGFSRSLAVPGEGPPAAELLVVGEGPGAEEDATGRPFVGPSGRFLRREMEAAGLPAEAAFITNVVKCRPPANRQPRADEVAICTSLYLARQVELITPQAVVALGAIAAGALLAERVRMTSDHGTWRRDYDLTERSLPVFVTYHPAAALRSERWRAELRSDMAVLAETWPQLERPLGQR